MHTEFSKNETKSINYSCLKSRNTTINLIEWKWVRVEDDAVIDNINTYVD